MSKSEDRALRARLKRWRSELAKGAWEAVRADLALELAKPPLGGDTALGLGELCEEVGLPALAARCYETVLSREPARLDALRGLVDLLRARGRETEATSALEAALRVAPESREIAALLARAPVEAPADAAEEDGTASSPSDADLLRFLELFAGREDVHARQWYDPDRGTGYSPVRQPLTPQLVKNHFLGNVSLGVYVLRRDGRCSFLALDFDIEERALREHAADAEALRRLRAALHSECERWRGRLVELGLPVLLEDSGFKGRHLWVLLAPPVEAGSLRSFGLALQRELGAPGDPRIQVEIFPKQARVRAEGLGNLIKLPLGIHRRTGRRSQLLNADGTPVERPWELLREQVRVSEAVILAALDRLPDGVAGGAKVLAGPRPSAASPESSSLGLWTRGHTLADPLIRCLRERCGALDALVRRGLAGVALQHAEHLVLRHTLGHLPQGVAACNHIARLAPHEFGAAPLGNVLRGSPMSCARLRQRLAGSQPEPSCDCSFPFAADCYPHPLLWLRRIDPEQREAALRRDPASVEVLAEAWLHLVEDAAALPTERRQVETLLLRRLEGVPEREIATPFGLVRLVDRDGTSALERSVVERRRDSAS
ncbi:MAG: hypothetical protein JNM84_06400 [Planctomycetes bacterium]|nr:hypothetical protein [Planctomycetota bacterium]